MNNSKFCQHCGEVIDVDCVICPKCGKQVANVDGGRNWSRGRRRSKWVAFFLCLFLGFVGAHKFYDGKIGMGILYLCTGGLALIGVTIDLIRILGRPNPYYVPYRI